MRRIIGNHEFLWVVFGQVTALAAGILGLKILTNMLSTADFGLYQLAWSVAVVVALFMFNPMGQAAIRLLPISEVNGQLKPFVASTYRNVLKFGVALALAGLVLAAVVSSATNYSLALGVSTVLIVLGHGLSLFYQNMQTALRQRSSYALCQFAMNFGKPIASALVLLLVGVTQNNAAIALAAAGVFLLALVVVQHALVARGIADRATASAVAQSDGLLPDLLKLAAPMAIVGALTALSQQADRWVLGGMLDLGAVGVYTAIYQLATAPLNFAQGVANRFSLPIIFERMGSGKTDGEKLAAARAIRTLVILWSGMIAVVLLAAISLHHFIVGLATNGVIASSSLLLPILLTGMSLERTAQIMTVKGNLDMAFARYVPVRILHIVLLISSGVALTPAYGIYGFAYAQCIAGAGLLAATLWRNFASNVK